MDLFGQLGCTLLRLGITNNSTQNRGNGGCDSGPSLAFVCPDVVCDFPDTFVIELLMEQIHHI
jgi:hypothetical protein